ncbi:MAG: hypothetical protein KGZ72_06195 [Roseovarius sp.]|jgi:hypothetical protein|nr:hypothetical protein [Roseovarius sp.]
MPRKSFSKAPKPAAHKSLEDFEKWGRGHDTARKLASYEPVARFTIDIPKRLHKRFKAACSFVDTSMRNEIILAIEERISELEERWLSK